MIDTPVEFDEEERLLVQATLDADGFAGSTWASPELATLRARIKQHYVREQGYRCCYCQQPLYATHGRVWDIEHVIARDTRCDFMFVPQNLAVACVECNQSKGTEIVADPQRRRFPDQAAHYRIVHPHFHNWIEHIELEGEGTYHALTKEGKFTIYHCDLFRFRERVIGARTPIRDQRFERDIGELRLARSLAEARPIIASILARLEVEEEATTVTDQGSCEL